MSDIVVRLRESVKQARAADRAALLVEAADEIEQLRFALAGYTEGISSGAKTKLTLTDAEREAVEGAIEAEHRRGAWQWAATLRGLLERLNDAT